MPSKIDLRQSVFELANGAEARARGLRCGPARGARKRCARRAQARPKGPRRRHIEDPPAGTPRPIPPLRVLGTRLEIHKR